MSIQYRRDIWKVVPKGGNAVEVGVAEGLFSADILRMPIHFRHVYMVDRWSRVATQKGDASNSQEWHDSNLAQARARVAEFGDRAIILQGESTDMAQRVPDGSLSLVYIDGDHSFQGCLNDIKAWLVKLMPKGVMAFHDFLNESYGVRKAVELFAQSCKYEIHVLPEDKPEDAGAYLIC